MNQCKHCAGDNLEIVMQYDYHNVFICKACELWNCERIEDCCRNPHKTYVFQYVDGVAKFIREQCLNCGGCLNMSRGLPFKEYSQKVNEKYEFSREKLNDYKNERKNERDFIYATEKALKLAKSTYYKYLNHLRSDYWKVIRQKAFERDNKVCQHCHDTEATQVHHLSYENLGHELLEDLMSVCEPCHKKIHKI